MTKPNVLFILTDDQGAWALGSAGNNEIITKNLDKLAENGQRFENFFCGSPVCSPARASIVTGKLPSYHGVVDWIAGGNADLGDDKGIEYLSGQKTYIEELADNGYTCCHSGKWHLGASDKPKKGFSKWSALLGGGCNYYNPSIFENGKFNNPNEYVTDIITDKAIEYLEEVKNEPFYLSVHYTAPHSPWGPDEHPEKYRKMYENCEFNSVPNLNIHENQISTAPIGDTPEKRRENLTGYFAAITSVDENVGRMIKKLEEIDQLDNTIIIFTGDNGMNMGHHGVWGKGNGTYPQNMYDSSVKVPFIISSPFAKEKNLVNENLHSHLELYSTILEMCGIETSEKGFYSEVETPVKKENAVLISSEYGSVRMLRTEKRKLIVNYKNNSMIYYNLENDLNEENNLVDDENYQTEIVEMKIKLENLFDKYTTDENDARKFDVYGKGQQKLCNEENAFIDKFNFYHADKH